MQQSNHLLTKDKKSKVLSSKEFKLLFIISRIQSRTKINSIELDELIRNSSFNKKTVNILLNKLVANKCIEILEDDKTPGITIDIKRRY